MSLSMNLYRTSFIFVLPFLGFALFLFGVTCLAQEKKTVEKKTAAAKPAPKPAAKPATDAKKIAKKEITLTVKAAPATKPKTHTVKVEKFEVTLDLSGIVGAVKSTRIALTPKSWVDLSVVKAVKHGTAVKKGDVILQLDTAKIKKAIKARKEALPLADITLKAAERALAVAEKTTPMDLERGRRSKMEAEESLAYYEDIELPMQIRSEKEAVKSARNRLLYAEEELNQLKKMYEDDDVTEETEEIILLRSQNSVDSYRFSLERAETRMKRTLDTVIPRDHENRKRNLQRQQISWRSGEQSLREGLEKKRLETETARRFHKKTLDDLSDLEKDLKLMTVRAPHDGIVYLGISQQGKWITASTIERKLLPGGKLTPKEIVMTVTSLDALQLHFAVPENQLRGLAKDQKGTATMKWNSDIKLDNAVKEIYYVPNAAGTYHAVLDLQRGKKDLPVHPGMNAAVKIKVYHNERALTVPKAAIKDEGEKSFVTLKGGKKREVKKGKSNKTSTEILSGLKAGDLVELPAAASTVAKKPTTKISSSTKK